MAFMKNFSSPTQRTGEIGENLSVKYLETNGYFVKDRNFANKYGEIDIVAQKGDKWYFFEVKTGKKSGFINPAENLTEAKLSKFRISVQHYCMLHHIKNYTMQGIIVLLDPLGRGDIEILDLW